MQEFLGLLNAVLPVLGIVGAGFGMRRLNWLSEAADASLMRVVVNVLTPCLIADTILGNPAFARSGNVWMPPLLGFGTTVLGFVVSGWAARALGRATDGTGRRTFSLTAGLFNYGYVPLPLAQVLFTSGTVGVLFVQNIGVELAMWLVGLPLVSGRSWRSGWRHVLNPPVLAIVFTLAANLVVPRSAVPGAVLHAVHLLGQCAIPMGLILIGATAADLMPELHEGATARLLGVSCLVRLAVLPALILGVMWLVPAPREVREVLVLHAAMPAAVFPIVMARHFGGNAGVALKIVLGTSLVSVLTMPAWLKLGLGLLERLGLDR